MNTDAGAIDRLLRNLADGDATALQKLFEVLYEGLRQAARWQIDAGASRSLSPTELVHELYLKLATSGSHDWRDRAHFYRVASQAMRQLMIDRARARCAAKRGDGKVRVELDSQLVADDDDAESLLALHEALESLAARDPRLAEVVELRFFGGLSGEQIAQLLGVTERTVKRDWRLARAFLHARLDEGSGNR